MLGVWLWLLRRPMTQPDVSKQDRGCTNLRLELGVRQLATLFTSGILVRSLVHSSEECRSDCDCSSESSLRLDELALLFKQNHPQVIVCLEVSIRVERNRFSKALFGGSIPAQRGRTNQQT